MSDIVSAGQLRAFIERIERIEEEIKEANGDKSEIYKEARGCGFDVKAIRQCVAARKLDSSEREERNAIFDLYWSALNGSGTAVATRVQVHEPFDPETGEITQPETASQSGLTNEAGSDAGHSSDAGTSGQLGDEYAGTSSDKNPAPHSHSSASPSLQTDQAGEVTPPQVASPATPFDDGIPAFLKTDKPGCLKLKGGHCKISFPTEALCAECADKRARSLA